MLRRAKNMILITLVSAGVSLSGAAQQAGASGSPAPTTTASAHPPIIWPDPTPEELEILPREGCKHLYDINAPKPDSPEFMTWQYTADGICWDWYKRHVDQSFLLGDTPPPGFDPARATYYSLTDEQRRSRNARQEMWKKVHRPGPAGSDPGTLSPRLAPVFE